MGSHLPRAVAYSRASAKIAQDIAERDIMKKKYEADRDAFKSSPAGLRDARIRGLSKKASSAEEEIKQQLYNVMVELKDGTLSSIVTDLKLINEDVSQVSMQEIAKVFNDHFAPISKLKTMSEAYRLTKNNQSKQTPYDLLFSDLIDDVDIRFVMFATPETIVRSKTKMYKLPEELKESFLKHLKSLSLTNEQKALFKKYHGKSFEKVEVKEV